MRGVDNFPASWKIIQHNGLFKLITNFYKVAGVAVLISLSPYPALANPTGGIVSAGSAEITSPNSNTVQVNQTTDKAVIDWHSFNISPNEQTNFQQPSTHSIILNRIDPTQGVSNIAGKLTANGQVWLINPAGILFSSTARVDVGGLFATTANISNKDFMEGNYHFVQSPDWNGAIINNGKIVIHAGAAALFAPGVENNNLVQANMGQVVLAAGSEFTVDFYGDGLINFSVSKETSKQATDSNGEILQDGIKNAGKIIANGGTILMTAKMAKGIVAHVINMTGYVEATSAVQKNGNIILMGGDQGTVRVAGKINASSTKTKGGNIQILGEKILIDDHAKINASGKMGGGEILIGGDYRGENPNIPNAKETTISNTANILANALDQGNGGKIIVWSDNNTQFYGKISAKGGINGGNGGFVETSGKNYLLVAGGKVDASASLGLGGTWLLDPRNVAIDTSATTCTTPPCFSGGDPDVYTPDTNTSHVDVNDILASLQAGTSVTITTGNSGTQAGNISVNTAINKTSGLTPVTLTLDSSNGGGTITVSNPITSTSGALGVSLLSGNAITITSNITTNGGDFLSNSQNATTLGNGSGTTPGIINTGDGAVTISANQDAAGGQDFTMNSNSTITTTNNTANAIQIKVNTPSGGTGQASLRDITTGSTGSIIVATDGTFGSGTGNTTGSNIVLNAGNTLAGGDILLTTPSTVTFNGAINTTGTVTIFANTNATTGNFTMGTAGSITTTDATANAVAINVNTSAGGTGTAALRNITVGDGGTITVKTDTGGNITGGDITQPTGTLFAGTGTITLTNPGVTGRNIGTSGSNITIDAETLNATSGSGGIFITNLGTGNLNLGTINSTGDFSLTSTSSSAIMDSGTLTIAGQAAFDVGTNQDIILNTLASNFGEVAITSGRNVTINTTNAVALAASTVSGNLSVTSDGNITDNGNLIISGNATFAANNSDIILDRTGNDFSTIIITSGNNATLNDTNTLNMGDVTLNGNLTITSADLTQTASTALNVNGTTSLATSGHPITLNENNHFTGALSISNTGSVNPVSIVNNQPLALGTISTAGNSVTITANGDLTQTNDITSSGTVTLNSGTNNITLDAPTNNFGTLSITNANNASIQDTNGIVLSDITINGTFAITAGGNITQASGTTLNITGTSNFTAGTNNIILTGNNDFIGAVSLNNSGANPVSINDVNDLTFGTSSIGSNTFTVTAGGSITQTGAITKTAGGSSPSFTVSGSGSDILLASAANDFVSTPTFTFSGLGEQDLAFRNINAGATIPTLPVSLHNLTLIFDNTAINLPTTTLTGDLTITAGGNITQSGALSVAGNTLLEAGSGNDITLNTITNNFATAAIVSGNNVSLTDANAINLDTSTVNGTLNITAGGNITQSGALSITGASTFTVTTANTDVLLASNPNTFSSTSFATSGAGTFRDIALRNIATSASLPTLPSGLRNLTFVFDNAAIDLPATTVTGNLSVTSGDMITDSGDISVAGTLTATAIGGIILDSSGNTISNFNPSNSGNGDITLVNTASPLTVTGFSQSGGGTVNITNTGTLAIANGVTLNSGNTTITITATDLDLLGSIDSGTASTSITQNTDSGSIGLGNTAGTMTISGSELQKITATSLTLSAPNDGQILVDGISQSQSSNINSITLSATAGSAGSIIFENNPSTFNELIADASDSLNLNTNVSANNSLTFTASTNGILLGSPVSLTANGITFNSEINGNNNLTLDSGTGDIIFNADVGNITRLDELNIVNADNLTNNGTIKATSYTQNNGGLTSFGVNGLDLTGNALITENNVTGKINVAGLSLDTSFANLTGFVDGDSGQAAINKITLLNTITAGTHFFDGIDMYSPPPIPPVPPSPFDLALVPQLTFPSIAIGGANQLALFSGGLNYAGLFDLLDSGKKECINLSDNIVFCSE